MPEDDGVGIAAYLVPIALVARHDRGGRLRPAALAARPAAGAAAPGAAGAGVSDAELRRLDEDLARYE